jgi:hypothetical protein
MITRRRLFAAHWAATVFLGTLAMLELGARADGVQGATREVSDDPRFRDAWKAHGFVRWRQRPAKDLGDRRTRRSRLNSIVPNTTAARFGY